MKIMVIVPSLGRGGAETVAMRLSDYWVTLGHSVKFVIFTSASSVLKPKAEIIDLNLPAAIKCFKASMILRRAVSLRSLILKVKPDVIFSFMETANLPICVAKLIYGFSSPKIAISIRTDPVSIGFSTRILGQFLYRFANVIIFPTDEMLNRFKVAFPRLHRNDVKKTIVCNPIPSEFYDCIGDTFTRKPIILACGRLSPEKGFDLLLKSFALTKIARKSHRLVIMGGGSQRAELIALAIELGIFPLVDFLGDVPTPVDQMRVASLFVLSSRFEGFPNALAEAMACGCPSIAFNCKSGPAELIDDNENGVLVPAENVPELSASIDRLILDPERALRLGKRARESVRPLYLPLIANQWLAIAKELCKK